MECIRVAQQLIFCIFTFSTIEEGSSAPSPSNFDLDQLNAFVERYASRVPNFYRALLKREPDDEQRAGAAGAETSLSP